jgi:acyl-coenzyme A synthetase/AMP-(fatty) acid ligase
LFRVLWPLWAARPFYTLTCKQPFEFNAAARRFGRCVIISSPAFLTRITDFKSLQPAKVFGAIFSSGAALPEIAAEKIANEWGIAPIEVYGSTETGGIAWRTWEPGVGQTAWQPFKSVEVAAPEVEGGSLCVRSAWTWQTDWVDTGDLARVLTQGRFLLCGRADSVLKVEDKRISLTEMEARLVAHTLVNEVRLLILKSKRTSIGAVVVLSPAGRRRLKQAGTVKMRKLLMDSLRAWYEPVLLPRKWRFVQRLPDDAMGKVGMRALRALFTERP